MKKTIAKILLVLIPGSFLLNTSYSQEPKPHYDVFSFDQQLTLPGMAVDLVCTYEFEASGPDSAKLTLSVHGAGEVPIGIPAIVEGVWHHFLFERFKPYVEGGKVER